MALSVCEMESLLMPSWSETWMVGGSIQEEEEFPYPSRSLDDHRDGQDDVMGVDQTHSHTSEASKGCMHGIVCQDLAVDPVIGGGRDGPDEVGRVDVLDISVLEALLDLALQPGPHIFQDGVAAQIRLDIA